MKFNEAKKQAKNNPGTMYSGDAGNGHSFEVYFCTWRNRLITVTINNKTNFRFS